MPIARGLMQSARVSVEPTTCSLYNVTPSDAVCGESITFQVNVNLVRSAALINDGTFDIIDVDSGVIIASGEINDSFGSAGPVSISGSELNYIIRYNGYANLYNSSTSERYSYYSNRIATSTQITSPADGLVYCGEDILFCTARVSGREAEASPTGVVAFVFEIVSVTGGLFPITTVYPLVTLYETLEYSPSSGHYTATVRLQPLSSIYVPTEVALLYPWDMKVTAEYSGDNCHFGSTSTSKEFSTFTNMTTTLTILSPSDIDSETLYSYCISDPLVVDIQIGSSLAEATGEFPTGNVTFEFFNDATSVKFATIVLPVSEGGGCVATLPANTTPTGVTTVEIVATYESNSCYLSSSDTVLVTANPC